MLKLVVLPEINQIVLTRDLLIEKLRKLEQGDFAVSIGGNERESCEVMRQVKPVLQRILREQLNQLDRCLAEYGIDAGG